MGVTGDTEQTPRTNPGHEASFKRYKENPTRIKRIRRAKASNYHKGDWHVFEIFGIVVYFYLFGDFSYLFLLVHFFVDFSCKLLFLGVRISHAK